MRLWTSLIGLVKCRVYHADIVALVSKIAVVLPIKNIKFEDDLAAILEIKRIHYLKLKKIIECSGGKLQVIRKMGVFWSLKAAFRRPVILIGISILLFLIFYLPTRVLFFSVEGNQLLSDYLILEKAEQSGVSFGISRSHVRSEYVKNKLLESLPELQWACINTKGCTATITVRERSTEEKNGKSTSSTIVAARDGIVTNMSVFQGVPRCAAGDAVKRGQILISGIVDYGLLVKNTGAEGEIFAETGHELSVATPTVFLKDGGIKRKTVKYSFIVGKKLINFRKSSGISPVECVRMYKRKYITLPGGFCLPLAIVKETLYFRDLHITEDIKRDNYTWLHEDAKVYLQSYMVAGKIISARTTAFMDKGTCNLYGEYRCEEMIGSTRKEEMFLPYGKRD